MFNLTHTVTVNFPALDRLINYLEADQQKQLDAVIARLKASNAGLETVVAANGPK